LVLCWITAGRANSTGHAPDAPRFTPTVTPILTPIVPYRLTFDALRSGEVDAALLIHEGRLSFPDEGCRMIADIGLEWAQRRALPLPLGGNVIRRGLSRDVRARADAAIRDSIAYALDHRDEAMGWLTATGVALADRARLDRYLGMYANRDTLDMGDDGCAGVRAVLAAGEEMGWFTAPTVDFVQTARP
jgi:1,4-dihydroxy-6-naphthoate synthase